MANLWGRSLAMPAPQLRRQARAPWGPESLRPLDRAVAWVGMSTLPEGSMGQPGAGRPKHGAPMEPESVISGDAQAVSADPHEGFIEKVEVPRAADVLADQLRQRILSGKPAAGELLPPERELVRQTGLGRATVREALRILEAEDLIDARLGRYGGWVVTRPGNEGVIRSIDVLIRGNNVGFESLLTTRKAIEPACAALAAEVRTDDDLLELDRHSARLKQEWRDVPQYLLVNLHWHLAVVRATHNDLLIAVMSGLSDAIHAGTDIKDFNSDNVRQLAINAHDRVTEAIRAGDADAAFRRMDRHLHAFHVQATSGETPPALSAQALSLPRRR